MTDRSDAISVLGNKCECECSDYLIKLAARITRLEGLKPRNGVIKISVNGDRYTLPHNVVAFERVVSIYNELNPKMGLTGNPGIDFANDVDGKNGILLPGEIVMVKTDTAFHVDLYHNA